MHSIRNIDKKNTINVFRMVNETIGPNKKMDFNQITDRLACISKRWKLCAWGLITYEIDFEESTYQLNICVDLFSPRKSGWESTGIGFYNIGLSISVEEELETSSA